MSIKRIGNGLWEIRGRMPSGKSFKRRVRGTKADALAAEQDALRCDIVTDAGTMRNLIAGWMQVSEWEAATREYYRRGADDVLETIGSIKADRLRAFDCERALMSVKKGSTRRRARKTLTAALNHAVKIGAIMANPMSKVTVRDGCKPPSRDRYTKEEVIDLLCVVRGVKDVEPAVILSALLGMRRSEVCGLLWSDILFLPDGSGVVRIRRSCVEVAGDVKIKPPKTDMSSRDIPLVGYAHDRLLEIKGEGKVIRISPSSLSKKYERVVRSGMERFVRFGNLRHSFATMSLEGGMGVNTLAAALGHSRTETTMKYVLSLHSDLKTGMELVQSGIGSDTKVTHSTDQLRAT